MVKPNHASEKIDEVLASVIGMYVSMISVSLNTRFVLRPSSLKEMNREVLQLDFPWQRSQEIRFRVENLHTESNVCFVRIPVVLSVCG